METKKREFIEPNDLMKYIEENHCYAGLPMAAHVCTMELLTYAPRVDVVEVVHSQWVLAEDGKLICGNCKNVKVAYEQLCYLRSTGCWNYCPNCGAKMISGDSSG